MIKKISYLLFCAAALFLFFFLQNQIPLWSSDEGRYSEIARSMFVSKNFLISYFNGVPFTDKPFLAPFLTLPGFKLFGMSEISARLVPILSALIGIAALFLFSKSIFNERTAQLSAFILLTTMGYVLVGRFAVIDMLMTLWISLSVFCFMTAFFKQRSYWYLPAYVFMALGVMTKGLIGIILPGGIFFIFLLWTGRLNEIKRMHILGGILILTVCLGIWILLANRQIPDYFQTFIIEEHFHRSAGAFGRKRPFWFFIPLLFALGLPWTLFLPGAIVQGLKDPAVSRDKIKFLICWIFTILVFFSIPKSKLPYYILPTTVPLALLMGNFFATVSEKTKRAWIGIPFKVLAGISCLAVIGLSIYMFFFATMPEILTLRVFALAGIFLLAMGFISAAIFEQKNLNAAILILAITVYGGLLMTFVAMKIISPLQSAHEEIQIIRSEMKPTDTVSVFASPDRFSELPFYLGRRIIVVGGDWGSIKEETKYLSPQELADHFWDLGKFVPAFNNRTQRIFCLMEEDRFEQLKGFNLQNYRILKQGHGRVLIVNS